jgi:hypothetical protein
MRFRIIVFALMLCYIGNASIRLSIQDETKTVYVYAVISSSKLKKAVFTEIFPIKIYGNRDSFLESGEKNIALKYLETKLKKYMYINEEWDTNYVVVAGFYDDNFTKLTDRLSDEQIRQKNINKYQISRLSNYNFSFTYNAGDAYKN